MPLPAAAIQVPGQATQRQVRSDHEMVRAEGRGSAPAFFIAYVAGVGGGGGMAAVLRGAGAGGVSRQSGRAAGGAADGGKCGVAPVYSLVRSVSRPGPAEPGVIQTVTYKWEHCRSGKR